VRESHSAIVLKNPAPPVVVEAVGGESIILLLGLFPAVYGLFFGMKASFSSDPSLPAVCASKANATISSAADAAQVRLCQIEPMGQCFSSRIEWLCRRILSTLLPVDKDFSQRSK
jgi:hypothetical protein